MRTVQATYRAPDEAESVTRHFQAGHDVTSDYDNLVSKLTQLFPELSASNFTIRCTDAAGEVIVAASGEEVFVALGSMPPGATLNIVIEEQQKSQKPLEPTPGCGSCGGAISGHRYKCTVCADFDICPACEQRGRHSHHPVMRVTTDGPRRTGHQRTRLWDMDCHRQSPLFDEGGMSRGGRGRPFGSGFFHCLNQSAFQDFHQMATDLTKTWCGSMPPPKSRKPSTSSNKSDVSKDTENSSDTTEDPFSGYHGYTKSREFDQSLFTEMVDQMTENLNATMDIIGEKHQAEFQNRQQGEGPKDKYQQAGSSSETDLVQMTEMLTPMMSTLFDAVSGSSKGDNDSNQSPNQTDGETHPMSRQQDTDGQDAGVTKNTESISCTPINGQSSKLTSTGERINSVSTAESRNSQHLNGEAAAKTSFGLPVKGLITNKAQTSPPVSVTIDKVIVDHPTTEKYARELNNNKDKDSYNQGTNKSQNDLHNKDTSSPQRDSQDCKKSSSTTTKNTTQTGLFSRNNKVCPETTTSGESLPNTIHASKSGTFGFNFRKSPSYDSDIRRSVPHIDHSIPSAGDSTKNSKSVNDNQYSVQLTDKAQPSGPKHTFINPRPGTTSTLSQKQSNIPKQCVSQCAANATNTGAACGSTSKQKISSRFGWQATPTSNPKRDMDKQPHTIVSPEKSCQCGNPSDTKRIHSQSSSCSEPTPGTSRDQKGTTAPPDGSCSNRDDKLTDALARLETMGFNDVGGSLSRLLQEEDYDVWRVLERMLSDVT